MHLESIDISARLIFGACSLALMATIVALIRGNVIKEKYALLWLPLGAGFLIASLFPEVLVRFSERIQLHYLTVVILGVIVVFTTILLYFTARLSQMREEIKTLAQELALSRADRADRAGFPVPETEDREVREKPNPQDRESRDAAAGWVPAPSKTD